VAEILFEHPEIRQLGIQVHTSAAASEASSLYLSQLRANSVGKALRWEGVDPSRFEAKGMGSSALIYDDSQCVGPDEALSPDCRTLTSKNRRVVFHILRLGAAPPRPITGAPDGNASLLPNKEGVLPSSGVLPKAWVLSTKAVLPSRGALPDAGTTAGLPGATKALPDQGVLPRQGTTRKPDAPKEAAPKEAVPKEPPAKEPMPLR